MIITIVGIVITSLLVLVAILLRKRKITDDMAIACFILGISYYVLMGVGLYNGYLEPDHGNQRKENITSLSQAIEWNKEEHRCNNYIFRFTLREEDTIDLSLFEVVEDD